MSPFSRRADGLPVLQPRAKSVLGRTVEGDDPLLTALTEHSNDTAAQVHVVHVEAHRDGAHEQGRIDAIPASLAAYNLELSDDGHAVIYDYDTKGDRTGITSLLNDLRNAGIRISDLDTRQSSLEDIFVSLVRAP